MPWIRALTLVAAAVVLATWAGEASTNAVDLLAKDNSTEAGGWALDSSTPTGVQIRFVEGSLFGIGIVFDNTSQEPVTVIDARAVPPSRSIVSQVGTRLLNWDPPPCPPHIIGCVINSFFREPSASQRAEPVTVQPGKGVAAQLDFRIGSCSAVPFASFAPVTAVTLSYDDGEQQTFELGGATLRPARPPSDVCAPRPFSRLAVDGPFAGSTASTIPISTAGPCARTSIGSFLCEDADRCTRAGSDVTFRSGLFEEGDKPASRIEMRLHGYRGKGRYLVGRNAEVTTVVGIGVHGSTTYRAFAGSVTVDRLTAGTLEGRVRATLTGFRKRPFHASGTWACTLGARAAGTRARPDGGSPRPTDGRRRRSTRLSSGQGASGPRAWSRTAARARGRRGRAGG